MPNVLCLFKALGSPGPLPVEGRGRSIRRVGVFITHGDDDRTKQRCREHEGYGFQRNDVLRHQLLADPAHGSLDFPRGSTIQARAFHQWHYQAGANDERDDQAGGPRTRDR